MTRTLVVAIGLVAVCSLSAMSDEPKPQPEAKTPPYKRLLTGDDAKKAVELQKKSWEAEKADQYDKAVALGEELLALRTKIQGGDHWEAIDAKWELESVRKVAALPSEQRADWRKARQGADEAEQFHVKGLYVRARPLLEDYRGLCEKIFGEKHTRTATSYYYLASNTDAQGKFADAQILHQKALDLRRELLGDKHPDVAQSCNNLAVTMNVRGRYAEAQILLQNALVIRRELLGDKHPDVANGWSNLAGNLQAQGKYAEAQILLQKALDLHRELFGERHANTASSYNNLAVNLQSQGKYAEAEPLFQKALAIQRELFGEKHLEIARSYNNLAVNLQRQGKYAEAQQLCQKALDVSRELYGDKHAFTAHCYANLASVVNVQGKYVEAQRLYQKALDVRRELFGDKHPATATSYNGLAINLRSQGKYAEAQPLFQKALDLSRELLGDKHPDTADCYNGLAVNLQAQGKYADAQPLLQKALEVRRELLGERHPNVVISYSTLAKNLHGQGKYEEAQPVFQKALDLHRELFGDKHPHVGTYYFNLAANLQSQGKYGDAERLFQKALDLHRELLGDKHPGIADSYHGLAGTLDLQGKYVKAQPLHQKGLDLRRELLGEKHPDVAHSYNNLATNLSFQGKHAEAQALFQKALDLSRELLGERHPDVARGYDNLALSLNSQGKHAEALVQLTRAATAYEAARLGVSGRGLDRAVFGDQYTPYTQLAVTQANLRSPVAAWVAAETNLARGQSDETASYKGLRLTPDEQKQRLTMTDRLNQIQSLLLPLVSKATPTDADKDELAKLQDERREIETKLSDLASNMSLREVATLPAVQAAIPADAALVLWVDVSNPIGSVREHWGCVVRRTGEPAWERLPGTGANQTWTADDGSLPRKLREALASGTVSTLDLGVLVKRLYAQRLAPLVRHLQGVKTLYAIGVNEMAGIPVEVLTSEFAISYLPSGTFLARLKDRPAPSGSAMLALGDPVFSRPDTKPKAPTSLPSGGLLIQQVAPGGAAAKARLQAGDVLIRYGDTELTTLETLTKAIEAQAAAKEVSITVWREGVEKPIITTAPPGRLGVVLSNEPALEAITNRRKSDAMLRALRGGDWRDLPGTRSEVTQISRLFGPTATTLLDSAASEQSLDEFRRKGELSKFRFLHFATHGKANNVRTLESMLILAQDKLPENPIPRAGEPFINGQLSANEVLEFWELNAELVTLSACETAIGPQGGGDGLLGFAQAFLTRGSRAVCLSLWKVDDAATALLMIRFYQNLLGKREGLKAPMPKAAALSEAKQWLRELSTEEALKLTAAATNGVVRGKRGKDEDLNLVVPVVDPKQPGAKDVKPFAHPRYWAAFILIGDPN